MPAELEAFYRRYAQARQDNEHLVGILASVIVNTGFNRPRELVQPADFGLGPHRRPQRAPLSQEGIADLARSFFSSISV